MRMELPLLFDWFCDVNWQREIESAAVSKRAFDPDVTIHERQQLARDRQAQARPGTALLASASPLPELLKYLVNFLRRDTDTRIFDPDRYFAVGILTRAQRDCALISELAGVTQQVQDDLPYTQRIAAHVRNVWLCIALELDRLVANQTDCRCQHTLEDRLQIDVFDLHV